MARRIGKWRDRPSLGQIEELAIKKVAEFRHCLEQAGLSVPEMPPIPAEYIALTITELSLRSVENLAHDGKPMAGLLDMERSELLYEESDPPGRQSFSIAHELGHYFLHYLPAVDLAQQPTLFDTLEFPTPEPGVKLERAVQPAARFFRCSEVAVTASAQEDENAETPNDQPQKSTKFGRVGRKELERPETQAQIAKAMKLKEVADRTEWEANIFARALIMPSELVRTLNKLHAGDVEAMAEILGVTQTALRYRLNGMKLRNDENKGLLGPAYNTRPKSDDAPTQGSFF